MRYVRSILLPLLGMIPALGTQGQGMPNMPPPEVTVITVQPKDAPITFDYVGTVEASKTVEIRARIQGFVETRDFREGQMVEPGKLLFTIDPRPYEANLKIAQAQVAQAEASLKLAQQEVDRLKSVKMSGAIAASDLDKQLAQLANAAAALNLAKAERDKAELDVSYTKVQAPLKGFVGKAQKEIGSYVDNAANSLLTMLWMVDPIYVSFQMSERDYLALKNQVERGELKTDSGKTQAVIELLDGSRYEHKGEVDFESVTVDTRTGTVEMRATLPNPDNAIKPGQFVKALLEGYVLPHCIMVPQRAVGQSQQGAYVYVVTDDNKAELRIVKPGKWSGLNWIIEDGLKAGERVIVDGVMKVRPGAPVKPVPLGEAQEQEAQGAGTKPEQAPAESEAKS